MNSLPKTVTRQRRDCDLNPGPTAPESSTLTTRLPSHPNMDTHFIFKQLLLISASKVHFRVGVGEDQSGRFLRPEKAEQIPCGA